MDPGRVTAVQTTVTNGARRGSLRLEPKEEAVRLYPPVTQEEAATWLAAQASTTLGEEAAVNTADIASLAEAMSIISAVELPDDLEPLFP